MAIAGQISTVAANTEFLAMATDIFNGKQDSAWTQFTEVVPMNGQSLELDAAGPAPVVRKLTTTQRFGNLREYAQRIPAQEYRADAYELPRLLVDKDKSGIVQRRLSNYLAMAKSFFEKPVIDMLLSNPLGIDGVSLFNDSHPHAPAGGTWDNKVTTTFGQTALEAGVVGMRSYRLENGEPGGYYPTHLVVGPALEREALDLIGDARMMPVDSSGNPDAASSVVAAVTIKNWIGGRLNLIVIDRLADGTHDNDWYLMDLSKPGIRPLVVGEAIAPAGVVIDSPTSEPMVQRASYQYYVGGAAAIAGYAPQTVWGKIG